MRLPIEILVPHLQRRGRSNAPLSQIYGHRLRFVGVPDSLVKQQFFEGSFKFGLRMLKQAWDSQGDGLANEISPESDREGAVVVVIAPILGVE